MNLVHKQNSCDTMSQYTYFVWGDRMYCENCGEKRTKRKYCQHCGVKSKRKSLLKLAILIVILVMVSVGSAFFIFGDFWGKIDKVAVAGDVTDKQEPVSKEKAPNPKPKEVVKSDLKEEQKGDLTEIIAAGQETVYTIFTNNSQGSGFLYNKNGAVVTNAHVVEGDIEVKVKTVDGKEYPGTVIGYSNETDVAVIHVQDLVGQDPYKIEKETELPVGEEVIALGSPLGYENTATMGYITGVDREFILDQYLFDNVYQMSAPISPGSSGGPLISQKTEKIVAINSAVNTESESIGFSIPLHKVVHLIDGWIANPMSEEDILSQFYNAQGDYYFDGFWDYDDGYFDGGDYSDEENYHDYWEYDYDSFWEEYGSDQWDYDDYYDDEWYWDDSEYDDSYDESDESWNDNLYDEEDEAWDEWEDWDYEDDEYDDSEYDDEFDEDENDEDYYDESVEDIAS